MGEDRLLENLGRRARERALVLQAPVPFMSLNDVEYVRIVAAMLDEPARHRIERDNERAAESLIRHPGPWVRVEPS